MRRARFLLLLSITATVLIASAATGLSRQAAGRGSGIPLKQTSGLQISPAGAAGTGSSLVGGYAEEPSVLVRLYSGRVLPTTQEIWVTEIFREPSFTVLADPAISEASEEELQAHAREIFSLAEVSSLGSSVVSLAGGSAILNHDSQNLEIEISGQYVSGDTVRLIVSRRSDGTDVVSTSVVARRGKTVILAGAQARDGEDLTLVCLTPL